MPVWSSYTPLPAAPPLTLQLASQPPLSLGGSASREHHIWVVPASVRGRATGPGGGGTLFPSLRPSSQSLSRQDGEKATAPSTTAHVGTLWVRLDRANPARSLWGRQSPETQLLCRTWFSGRGVGCDLQQQEPSPPRSLLRGPHSQCHTSEECLRGPVSPQASEVQPSWGGRTGAKGIRAKRLSPEGERPLGRGRAEAAASSWPQAGKGNLGGTRLALCSTGLRGPHLQCFSCVGLGSQRSGVLSEVINTPPCTSLHYKVPLPLRFITVVKISTSVGRVAGVLCFFLVYDLELPCSSAGFTVLCVCVWGGEQSLQLFCFCFYYSTFQSYSLPPPPP